MTVSCRQMFLVENKSKEEIAEIGWKIGEAFAAEKVGIVTMVTEGGRHP